MPLSFTELRVLADLVKDEVLAKANTTLRVGTLAHEIINKIDECMTMCGLKKPPVLVFTESGEWTAPNGVNTIEVFAVGGGGAGANGSGYVDYGRNGGSGGQVVIRTLQITPGNTYQITIGAGGPFVATPSSYLDGQSGKDTSFDGTVTASGGLGGKTNGATLSGVEQPVVEGSATGGSSGNSYGSPGREGQLCPFDLSEVHKLDLEGKMFGASGAAGNRASGSFSGGETGGGDGAGGSPSADAAQPGMFYGAGGGGGGKYLTPGGAGYQGILIITYK
ncbi:MAG: hypothetical protein LBJ39_03360 [Tannerellaceae bacterium]|jgi:hypothetical protein|nr:hypothetical protein [Tannerellaceae bacterium]